MNTFLVLKRDPNQEEGSLFKIAEETPNSIEFTKTKTKFGFNKVFNNSSPDDVFNSTSKPLIDNYLLQNKDSLLFTLGPTNSGKSHLMFKNSDSILNQSLNHIFSQLEGQLTTNITNVKQLITDVYDKTEKLNDTTTTATDSNANKAITISMFEIHKDKIKDLLAESHLNQKVDLGIINDKIDGKLRPHHMTRSLVNSYKSANDVVQKGLSNRCTSFTNMNSESSRSHCFIFIDLHNFYGTFRKTHRLTLADLAGLERSKTSKTTGEAFKEANYTNNSMTALGIALESHAIKQFNMSSLRANKLTRLIMTDHIKSNTPVSLVVALDPFGEQGLVHQTLKYINPIKYQDLKKKVSSPLVKGKVNQAIHHGIINELTGYANEWRHKYKSSKEESILAESKLRDELYKSNEKKLQDLEILHKTEAQRLKECFDNELNEKIDELSSVNQKKIVNLNKDLSAIKNESLALKNELEIVYREKLLLENDLQQSKNEVSSKIDKLESEIQFVNDKSVAYQEEISILKLEIDEVKKEVVELTNQIGEKNQNIDALNAQINEKIEVIEQIQIEKSTLESSIQNLNTRIAENESLNEQLETKNIESSNCLEAKEKELQKLSYQIQVNTETYTENIFKLEEDLKMEQFRVESLEDMKCKLENQLKNSLDKHLDNVDNLKTEFATKLKGYKEDIDNLERLSMESTEVNEEDRLISYEMTINELNEEIEGHRMVSNDLERKIQDLVEENEKAISEREEKLKLVEENSKVINSKNTAELIELTSKMENIKEENRSITDKNSQLVDELNVLKTSIAKQKLDHISELNKLTLELDELKKLKKRNSRKSLVDDNASLLDSDFTESFNIIKDVKSSPLKPAFEIHHDDSPSTPSRSKKSPKQKKTKSDIAQSKLEFAVGKTNGKYSATPSPRKTPLGKLNSSALNRKEMQLDSINLMGKFSEKKRKSSSPIKSKSKLRKLDVANSSFDNLD